MLVHIETPNLPSVVVSKYGICSRLLSLPFISPLFVARRRKQLRIAAHRRDSILTEFINAYLTLGQKNFRRLNVNVRPFRAITSHGEDELSHHPLFKDLFHDLNSYHVGQFHELDFQLRYGFSTEKAVDAAFDYLNGLDAVGLCWESETTALFEYRNLAFVIGYLDTKCSFISAGLAPKAIDSLFPSEFSDWTPTEPIWNRFDEENAVSPAGT